MSPTPPVAPDANARQQALEAVVAWYDHKARTLPWRTDPDPWAVLVSEVMLQQTPVTRVLPVFESWMARWPTPAHLAGSSPGDAVREWGRLGYPRRALRLHAAAVACVDWHDGAVPSDLADLRALPGVGEYTAAAVAAFAFGQRHAVLDTNVRRVHARWLDGVAHPPGAVTAAERSRALALLPSEPGQAAHTSVAVMELGALVCTSRSARCAECPVRSWCRWQAAGHPEAPDAPRRTQAYDGTDRQCRGRLLAALRDSPDPVSRSALDPLWGDSQQLERALASLVADGLAVPVTPASYRLP